MTTCKQAMCAIVIKIDLQLIWNVHGFFRISRIFIPRRVFVALMMWVAEILNTSLRVNLSVNIVSMVPVSNITSTVSSFQEPESLGWSSYERGLVLGAQSWGSLVTNICGGYVSKRFGARLVIFSGLLMKAVLAIASPATAKTNYLAMVFLRIGQGLCGGLIWPALNDLLAHWAPTFEKNKFFAFMEFGSVGTMISWSLCGIIIDSYGWEWGFYVFGIAAIIFIVSWWFLIYDSPKIDPYISDNEKQYITDGTTGVDNDKMQKIPYAQILTSVPMWATFIGSIGVGWLASLQYLSGPLFIASVLNKDAKTTSYLSSVISLTQPFSSIIFGTAVDYLLKRKILSLRIQRKSFTLISHILPAFVLVALAFTKGSVTSLVLFALFTGMHGAMTVTTSINGQDIAPNFAGTVCGLATSGFTISGLVSPMVVAYFTRNDETSFEAWQLVFFTGATVCSVSGIIFLIFGSTDIQPWNDAVDVNIKVEEQKQEMTITKSIENNVVKT